MTACIAHLRSVRRRIVATPFLCTALAGSSLASPSPQWTPQENGIGSAYPIDTAVSYNGRRAAVRSGFTTGVAPSALVANGITFWDLTSATTPTSPAFSSSLKGEAIDLTLGLFNGYQPSDALEMTNTEAIAVGSGYSSFLPASHDETYIDLFLWDASIPNWAAGPSITFGPTLTNNDPWDDAGWVNDLAITRDGDYAIINDNNHVYRVTMGTGAVSTIWLGRDWGPANPWTNANLCTPNGAVDSVALSNETAVITTSRVAAGGLVDTWVYLIDIASWTVQLEQRIVPANPTVEAPFRPHDVAITPDQSMAVVTSNRIVSLFDLTNYTLLAMDYEPDASRLYQRQVDSVEVTNDRAVVLSDDVTGGTARWRVDVYSISTTGPGFLTKLQTYLGPTGPQAPETRSHDLAISAAGKRAVVRTSFENVYITDLVTPPVQASLPNLVSPNGSDAHLYLQYPLLSSGYYVFSSDSVVIVEVGNTEIAATIGAYVTLSGQLAGQVDFFDLTPPTITVAPMTIAPPTQGVGSVPLDLSPSRDRTELVVRSAEPFVDLPTASGSDVNVFSMSSPFTQVQSHGGIGHVMGVDSLAVGTSGGGASARKRIISSSQDDLSVTPDGRIHLVDRP